MRNIYNKGKYRNGEWAKHLRPVGKRIGNKRWRKTGRNMDCLNLDEMESTVGLTVNEKKRKVIKVVYRIRSIGDYTYKRTSRYHSIRSANDAMKRRNVIDAKILNNRAVANTRS